MKARYVLNELKKDSLDVMGTLGIGKDHAKRMQISGWLDEHHIKNHTVREDLKIDVDGDVAYWDWNEKYGNLPEYVTFDVVNGDFNCSINSMTSLRGCPRVVNGDFKCFDNMLTSLDGCPEEVSGNFECYGNRTSFSANDVLRYCYIHVGGEIINLSASQHDG